MDSNAEMAASAAMPEPVRAGRNYFAGLPSEHEEQAALVKWCEREKRTQPLLGLLVAVPNFPGKIGAFEPRMGNARRLNAEGRRKGYPDLMLDVGRGGYLGWRGEMKKRSKWAHVEHEQKLWHERLRVQGYRVDVCYGFEHAKQLLLEYLALPPTPCPHRLDLDDDE